MSLEEFGTIHTNFNSVDAEITIAFEFERIANALKIGTRIGGNISKYVYDNYFTKRCLGNIPFELTNSPLDPNVEELFMHWSYEQNEPYIVRMRRVQQLFERILNINGVLRITLIIASQLINNNDKVASIKISEFCNSMLKIEDVYFSPPIRLIITK